MSETGKYTVNDSLIVNTIKWDKKWYLHEIFDIIIISGCTYKIMFYSAYGKLIRISYLENVIIKLYFIFLCIENVL